MTNTIIAYIAIIILCIITWAGASAIEASTYSRLTGKQVTVFDAMFIDLRVVDGVK
jgi:hypothetical protein